MESSQKSDSHKLAYNLLNRNEAQIKPSIVCTIQCKNRLSAVEKIIGLIINTKKTKLMCITNRNNERIFEDVKRFCLNIILENRVTETEVNLRINKAR